MPKWEYKTVGQGRGWDNQSATFLRATQWEPKIDLTALGEEGWELVSVVASSSVAGGSARSTMDMAGLTTQQLWVFKRPRL
jgi:hypothetical protein